MAATILHTPGGQRMTLSVVALVTGLAGSSAAQDTAGMAVPRGRVVDVEQVPRELPERRRRMPAPSAAGGTALGL